MEICKFFARGHCMRGDACRYSHDTASQSFNPSKRLSSYRPENQNGISGFTLPTQKEASVPEPRLNPRAGSFEGNPSPSSQLSMSWRVQQSPPVVRRESEHVAHSTPDSRSRVPCHHHAKGNCRNGSACPYYHGESNDQIVAASSVSEDTDNFTRELFGALVQFEHGAQVAKTSLPIDFSAARINGLPIGTSPTSMATLLSTAGIHITPDCIQIRQGGPQLLSALVTVEDPGFASMLCSKLGAESAFKLQIPQLEVVKIPAVLSSSLNARRVERRKVRCSWYKPSRTAWLNFGNEKVAKKVFEGFSSGTYNIENQAVTCKAPTTGRGRWRNPLAWTLMLTDLPADTSEKDIRSAIRSPHQSPRNIELGQPSYKVHGEQASTTVLSMLNRVGPIEWSQANTETKGKRAKVTARFREEADASEAVRALHNKPLSFCRNMKLTVQLVCTAKFKVASNIYKAVEPRIHAAKRTWPEHLHFMFFPAVDEKHSYCVLRIEGHVADDVTAAKKAMDQLLDGVTVMSHGSPVWSPSLSYNGTAFQLIKKMERDHGVVVIRNKRKEELRLYCASEQCAGVEAAIVDIVKAETSVAHIIELTPEEFSWACMGGFKRIVAVFGEGTATFDIASTPKKVVINGSEKQLKTAQRLVREQQLELNADDSVVTEDCAVCWTPAENTVFTECKHAYCIECFEAMCIGASPGDQGFSIRCLGNSGKCQEVLKLEELHESLSSKTFEDMLETSFTTYVRRHPLQYRYCPKADCSTIYRVSSAMEFSTCSECLTVTCTACHNEHQGWTCAEFRDQATGGYEALERLKKELGIKDCPKCKTSIEKTYGCNHMTCRGCGTHICWVCLETFLDSRSCYDHMQATH